jgi:hypothetical protein
MSVFSVECVGASVLGRRHAKDGAPNQDAWGHYRCPTGHLAVVCDGVGSCELSHLGSRAACAAVREVAQSMTRDSDYTLFGRLVDVAWRAKLPEGDLRRFATTCLFTLRLRSGRILIGGVGDGLVAMGMVGGGPTKLVDLHGGEFGETCALGGGGGADAWHQQEADDARGGMWSLLATDGLSTDLDSDRLGAFADWLVARVGPLSARRRAVFLRSQLSRARSGWGSDDQTLALQWSTHHG